MTVMSRSFLAVSFSALPSVLSACRKPMCKLTMPLHLDSWLTVNRYMFDEPSSYLDVKQRLSAARIIRSLLRPDDYVIVVEHDLSVLDYLSDYICVLYGQPAVYGVVTLPYSVREGINIFLDGHIPTENLRFREESLTFRIAEGTEEFIAEKSRAFRYPAMQKTLGNFKLSIESGAFSDSEIIVMMGENGTGKVSGATINRAQKTVRSANMSRPLSAVSWLALSSPMGPSGFLR